MIKSTFLEILVFCVKILSFDANFVEFDMIQDNRQVYHVIYKKKSKIHGQLSIIHQGRKEETELRFVDNGIYEGNFGGRKIKLDIARYFIQYYKRKAGPRNFEIKDSKGKKLYFSESGNRVYILSQSEKTTFVIQRKYFK